MEKEKIKLSIIILSYNSQADLERLLPSVFGSEGVFFYPPLIPPLKRGETAGDMRTVTVEVIVVDNGSTDGILDWLQTTNYPLLTIANTNTGFANGNNIGIKQARGKYILLLNPDTKLERSTLKCMLDFMESHLDVGIATCKVLLPSGKLDLACRRRFPNPWNSFKALFLGNRQDYNYIGVSENVSMEIDSCMGAFMMIRRNEEIENERNGKISNEGKRGEESKKKNYQYLDENFFMYGEDLDLCFRYKQAGKKIWYYPETFITHFKGSSSLKVSYKALKWFHDAMWIFYKKHYIYQYNFLTSLVIWLVIYLRFLFLILVNFFRKKKFVSKR